MKPFNVKVSAFLLIEHLIALSIFGLGMLLCLSILRLLSQVEQRIAVADEIEWHLMVTQLDSNLSNQTLQTSNRFLYVNQVKNDGVETVVKLQPATEAKKSVFVLSKNKGYHPILLGYRSAHLYRKGNMMQIDATLLQGNHFQIDFIPAKRVIDIYRVQSKPPESAKEVSKNE